MFYSFIKTILSSGLGMSLNDIMSTSWQDLMGMLEIEKMKREEQVIDLVDFI